MVVDVSGLDIFKEPNSADLNIKFLPQYAENNQTTTATDAVYASSDEYAHRKVKFRSTEEEKLLRHMAKIVTESENNVNHPYLDSKGLITVGKGNNINRWDVFKAIQWEINGHPATKQEIKKAYDILIAKRIQLQNEYNELMELKRLYPQKYAALPESQKKEKGPFNYGASYYAQFTNIKISQEEIDYHTFKHLQNDYDVLRKAFTNFDAQPMEFKEATFDIQYNVIGGINSFGKFINAYKSFMQTHSRTDFEEMLKQSHRIGVGDTRNSDTIDRLIDAYGHTVNDIL